MQDDLAGCHNPSSIFSIHFHWPSFCKCVLNWLIALRYILTFTNGGECLKHYINRWSTISGGISWTSNWPTYSDRAQHIATISDNRRTWIPHPLTRLRSCTQHGHRRFTQMMLLVAMDAACEDIAADAYRGWMWHSRTFSPRCIAREDANPRPEKQECQEVQHVYTL